MSARPVLILVALCMSSPAFAQAGGVALAQQPIEPEDLELFAGALITLEHRQPVQALYDYWRKLIEWGPQQLPRDLAAYQRELRRARHCWDLWDDLRIAVAARRRGDRGTLIGVLSSMREKLGPEAYYRGELPLIPEWTWWWKE